MLRFRVGDEKRDAIRRAIVQPTLLRVGVNQSAVDAQRFIELFNSWTNNAMMVLGKWLAETLVNKVSRVEVPG